MKALTIEVWIDTRREAVGDAAKLVHHDALQRDVATDLDVRQDDRVLYQAVLSDSHP